MRDDPRPVRPVTHWTCARLNATRWGLIGGLFGLVATAIGALR